MLHPYFYAEYPVAGGVERPRLVDLVREHLIVVYGKSVGLSLVNQYVEGHEHHAFDPDYRVEKMSIFYPQVMESYCSPRIIMENFFENEGCADPKAMAQEYFEWLFYHYADYVVTINEYDSAPLAGYVVRGLENAKAIEAQIYRRPGTAVFITRLERFKPVVSTENDQKETL